MNFPLSGIAYNQPLSHTKTYLGTEQEATCPRGQFGRGIQKVRQHGINEVGNLGSLFPDEFGGHVFYDRDLGGDGSGVRGIEAQIGVFVVCLHASCESYQRCFRYCIRRCPR